MPRKIDVLYISDSGEATAHISQPAPSETPGNITVRLPRQSNGAALIHIKEHALNPFRSDDYDAGHLPRRGR